MHPRQVPALGLRAASALAASVAISVSLFAGPAPTPQVDWLFNGPVNGVAVAGHVIYVGGQFTRVAPRSSAMGHLVALSPITGSPVASAPPIADEIVTSIAPDSSGGYYLAGRFTDFGSGTAVPGQNTRLAHVLADGNVDTGFAPAVTGPISSLAFAGPSVVVMGDVTSGDRRDLLVFDAVSGQLQPWTPVLPGANPRVRRAAASAGMVYVLWDDALSSHVTAFDGGNGWVAWTADLPGPVSGYTLTSEGPNRVDGALAVAGRQLVAGVSRLFAIDVTSGAVDTNWGSSAPPFAGISDAGIHGSVVYIGGTFQFGGPGHLAALAVATGAVLRWAPRACVPVRARAGAADGTVFVGADFGEFRVDGHPPTGIAAIDAAGVVRAWAPQPAFGQVTALAISSQGALIAGTSLATSSSAARTNVAAFDAATGELLPTVPLLSFGASDYVADIAGVGTTLFVSVDRPGVPEAVILAADVTGAGTPSVVTTTADRYTFGPATAGVLYIHNYVGALRIETGARNVDASWRAEGFRVIAATPHLIGVRGAELATLSPITGAPVNVVPAVPAPTLGGVDGDTFYGLGTIPGTAVAQAAFALDAQSGTAVSAPAVSGRILTFAVADGRLFFGGGDMTTPAGTRSQLIETDRRGVPTAWDAGFRPHAGPFAPGVVTSVKVLGNRLAVTGSAGFWDTRVAVFDLHGPTGPTALRSEDVGTTTVFTWDGVAPPEVGNYVLEAGYAPGQAVVQVPVGAATTFAAPGPIPGPVFVRVRATQSANVSNEIVMGCTPPAPPARLTAAVSANLVTLSWQPQGTPATSYTLVAGTTTKGSQIGALTLGGTQTSFGTAAPAGTYFIRVRAANPCGTSGDSGEVFFTIGAPVPLPPAPSQPVVIISGGADVTMLWDVQPIAEAVEYVLEVGGAPGLADLGTFRIARLIVNINGTPMAAFFAGAVPRGTYYLRVRAVNSAGSGPPSPDAVARVP